MKIEHLCHANFSWSEIQKILADHIELFASNEIAGSKKNLELLELAQQARGEHSFIEQNEDGLILVVDGVAYTESFE